MSAQSSSATNVVQLDAAGRRQAKIVAAARVVSIDYRLVTSAADGSFVNSFPVPDQDVDRAAHPLAL